MDVSVTHYIRRQKQQPKDNEVVVNVIEDRSSFRIGRGVTPDAPNIFKTNETAIQSGDVSIADTGWGQTGRKTPQRKQKTELRNWRSR